MRLLDGEQLLISEEDSLPLLSCGPKMELTASLRAYALAIVRKQLAFLELVRIELRLLFHHPSHWSVVYVCLTGDFSHIDSKISPGWLLDDPTVPGGVGGALSPFSRMNIFMDKLIESFNRIWHDLFRNAQQTNIFSGGVFLDEAAPKLHHVCLRGWEKITTKQ